MTRTTRLPGHVWGPHPLWSHDTRADSTPVHCTASIQYVTFWSSVCSSYGTRLRASGNPSWPHTTLASLWPQLVGQMNPQRPLRFTWTWPSEMKSPWTGPRSLTSRSASCHVTSKSTSWQLSGWTLNKLEWVWYRRVEGVGGGGQAIPFKLPGTLGL